MKKMRVNGKRKSSAMAVSKYSNSKSLGRVNNVTIKEQCRKRYENNGSLGSVSAEAQENYLKTLRNRALSIANDKSFEVTDASEIAKIGTMNINECNAFIESKYRKKIGYDTFSADANSLMTDINSVYDGWKDKKTVNSVKKSVENMYNRVLAFKEYNGFYHKNSQDINDTVEMYKNVLDDLDELSDIYSKYDNANEYNAVLNNQKIQNEKLERSVDDYQAEIDYLKDLSNRAKITNRDFAYKEFASGFNNVKYNPFENLNNIKQYNGNNLHLPYSNKSNKTADELQIEAANRNAFKDYNNSEEVFAMINATKPKFELKSSNKVTDFDIMQKDDYLNYLYSLADCSSLEELNGKITELEMNQRLASRHQKMQKFESVSDINSENYDGNFKLYTKNKVTSIDSEYLDAKDFKYLTDSEVEFYTYYNQKDKENETKKADEYLDLLQQRIENRKGIEKAEELKGKTTRELLYSSVAGFDQFGEGIKNFFNFNDDYIPVSATQVASGLIREDLADVGPKIRGVSLGQLGYDMGTTTANMLPSILVSTAIAVAAPVAGVPAAAAAFAGNVAGGTLMGVSAAGNAYQVALNSGMDKASSRCYAELVGVSEAGLSVAFSKVLGGKALSQGATKAIAGIDSGLGRFAANVGWAMATEGAEESAQEILNPLFENIALGYTKNTIDDINWSEVAYAGMLGAISGGIFESVSGVHGLVLTPNENTVVQSETNRIVKQLNQVGLDINENHKNNIENYVKSELVNGNISVDNIKTAFNNSGENTEQRIAVAINEDNQILNGRTSYLAVNYSENERKAESFNIDLSQVDENHLATYKNAVESGALNNTEKTHNIVESFAKISAERGFDFEFTNNQKAADGKYSVNDNTLIINMQSNNYLNSIVGYDVVSVFENSEYFAELNSFVTEYSKSNGEYEDYSARFNNTQNNVNSQKNFIANVIGDYLFSGKEFITEMFIKDRVLFERVYNEINYLCSVLPQSSKEQIKLNSVKNQFAEVYNKNSSQGVSNVNGVNYDAMPTNVSGNNTSGAVYTNNNLNFEQNSGENFAVAENSVNDADNQTDRSELLYYARCLGINVEFQNLDYIDKNGRLVSPEGLIKNHKDIIINENAENPIGFILKHELTHFCETAPSYADAVYEIKHESAFYDWLLEKTNSEYLWDAEEKYRELIVETYPDINDAYSPKVETEMIAGFIAEKLWVDSESDLLNFANEVKTKKHNKVVQFIIDFISFIKKKIKGRNNLTLKLSVLEDTFKRLFGEAVAVNTENNAVTEVGTNAVTEYCFVLCSDSSIIEKADKMKADGVPPYKILRELGVLESGTGDWLRQLDIQKFKFFCDGNANTGRHTDNRKLKVINGKISGKLRNFVEWPDLFKMYPRLANADVEIIKRDSSEGDLTFIVDEEKFIISRDLYDKYIPFENEDLKSELVREIQKALQFYEERRAVPENRVWENISDEEVKQYSEKMGKDLTREDLINSFYDNYEASVVQRQQDLRNYGKISNSNISANYKNLAAALPRLDKKEMLRLDDNGRLITSYEYEQLQKNNIDRYDILYGDYTADDTKIIGKSNEIIEKGKNASILQSHLLENREYKRKYANEPIELSAGNEGFIIDYGTIENAREIYLHYLDNAKNPTSNRDSTSRYVSDEIIQKTENTVFKNDDGELLSLYFSKKSVSSPNFANANIGLNVGTLKSAINKRTEYRSTKKAAYGGVIEEVYAISKNPLFLSEDIKPTNANVLLEVLKDNAVVNDYEIKAVTKYKNSEDVTYSSPISKKIRELLKSKGYDSIIYPNNSGDKGNLGVLLFDEWQIIPVAENGSLIESSGVTENDFVYENNTSNNVTNADNRKILSNALINMRQPQHTNKKQPSPQIDGGNSGCFENSDLTVEQLYNYIKTELQTNADVELSVVDTANRTLNKRRYNNSNETVFKNKDGEILSFYHISGGVLLNGERLYKQKLYFSNFDVALNKYFDKKVDKKFVKSGSIEECYLNSVNPFILKTENAEWNAFEIAKTLLDDGYINEKRYQNLIGPPKNKMDYRVAEALKLLGIDSLIFVGEINGKVTAQVMPLQENAVTMIAENGISKTPNTKAAEQTVWYNNDEIKDVSIDYKKHVNRNYYDIREKVEKGTNPKEKLTLLTQEVELAKAAVLEGENDIVIGNSSVFEKGETNVLKAKSRFENHKKAVQNVEIADCDVAGRTLTQSEKSNFANTVFKNEQGKLISFFAHSGKNGAFNGKFGFASGTMAAARQKHKMSGKKGRTSFIEVNYNIENPYFVKEDISDMNVAEIAEYMFENNVITKAAYKKINGMYSKNPNGNNYSAERKLISELKNQKIDGLVFMQEKYDAGSMGVIAFDENQVRIAARHTVDKKGHYKLTSAEVAREGSISASEMRNEAVRRKVDEILKNSTLRPKFKDFVEGITVEYIPIENIDINNFGEYNGCDIVKLKTLGEQKNTNVINSKTGAKYKQVAFKIFNTIYIDKVPDFEEYTVYKCKLPIEYWFLSRETQKYQVFKRFEKEKKSHKTKPQIEFNEEIINKEGKRKRETSKETYECHHYNLILGEFWLVDSYYHARTDHCGGRYIWPILMEQIIAEFYKSLENER